MKPGWVWVDWSLFFFGLVIIFVLGGTGGLQRLVSYYWLVVLEEEHLKFPLMYWNWVVVSNHFICFTPFLGKIPTVTDIVQRGWFNHQLEKHFILTYLKPMAV